MGIFLRYLWLNYDWQMAVTTCRNRFLTLSNSKCSLGKIRTKEIISIKWPNIWYRVFIKVVTAKKFLFSRFSSLSKIRKTCPTSSTLARKRLTREIDTSLNDGVYFGEIFRPFGLTMTLEGSKNFAKINSIIPWCVNFNTIEVSKNKN